MSTQVRVQLCTVDASRLRGLLHPSAVEVAGWLLADSFLPYINALERETSHVCMHTYLGTHVLASLHAYVRLSDPPLAHAYGVCEISRAVIPTLYLAVALSLFSSCIAPLIFARGRADTRPCVFSIRASDVGAHINLSKVNLLVCLFICSPARPLVRALIAVLCSALP